MTNSICFSSDMSKIYLIDNDRCVPFDLTKKNGVLVGLIKDQIAVVSAARELPEAASGKKVNRIVYSTKNSQITVVYNDTHTTMFVIGALEIDSAIAIGEEPKSKIKSINLSKGAVNIRREDTKIEIIYLS